MACSNFFVFCVVLYISGITSLKLPMSVVTIMIVEWEKNTPEYRLQGPQKVEKLLLNIASYITPCVRLDPNFSECAEKAAKSAIPEFIKGDPKYNIPPLDPLIIPELKLDQDVGTAIGFSFVASNVTLKGLAETKVDKIVFDTDKNHVEYHLTFPTLEVDTRYNISGNILVVPIAGDGKANITLTDAKIKYMFEMDEKKRESDGKTYASITNPRIELQVGGRAFFNFENLFNGDKTLGDRTNEFLNENWKDLVDEVGPSLSGVIAEAVTQILERIFTLVPVEEAFL